MEAFFSPEKNGVVSSSIQSYRQGEMHFYHLTEKAADVLKEELNKYAFNETGYLIFCHYRFVADEYVMIALVNVKEHYSINQELDLTSSRHLDIAKMQLAARIDLNGMATALEDNRYISFIKGRAGREAPDNEYGKSG